MLDVVGDPPAWEDEFVRAADMRNLGMRADMQRDLRAGLLVPIARGVYRRAEFASADDADDHYLALLRGTQLAMRSELVFAQLSAARIWQLPIIGTWPPTVHVTDERRDGSRSTAGIIRHNWGMPAVPVDVQGLRVTPLVQTVVDVARCAPFEVGVAVADAALRGLRARNGGWMRAPLPRAALHDAVQELTGSRGCVRAREVAAFADGRSESAGESLSRVAIRKLRLPAPVLQREFRDHLGRMIVDFWWPDANLAGEFDGKGKYLREEYTRGRTTAEIVLAEKAREDRLRTLGPRVTRWGWDEAKFLPMLRARLFDAGLRPS